MMDLCNCPHYKIYIKKWEYPFGFGDVIKEEGKQTFNWNLIINSFHKKKNSFA